jgi:hypothetical protein
VENKVIYLTERINKKNIEKNAKSYEEYLSKMYASQLSKDFENILNEGKSKINERMKK